MQPGDNPATVSVPQGMTSLSAAAAKVALLRDLFAGRTDVFPVRWENARAERAGYAPACANEWVTGICGVVSRGWWEMAEAA